MQELHLFCQQRFKWEPAHLPAACARRFISFLFYFARLSHRSAGNRVSFSSGMKVNEGRERRRAFMWP